MADRKKAPSEEEKLDAIVDEGFDEDYVYIDDEDGDAYPVPMLTQMLPLPVCIHKRRVR